MVKNSNSNLPNTNKDQNYLHIYYIQNYQLFKENISLAIMSEIKQSIRHMLITFNS